MKIKLLVLFFATVLLCNCKKNTSVDNTANYITATVDGKNYRSNDIMVIRTPLTNDLFSFFARTPDSLFIGLRLNPAERSYQPGKYSLKTYGSQDAVLARFIIKDSNSIAVINWVTTQEMNLSYFEIDRSADGSYFTPLAKVAASRNNTGTIGYTYTDGSNATVQNFYYRLKIVNLDGSFHYSATVSYDSPYLEDMAYYGEKSFLYKGFNGSIQVTSNDKTRRIVTGNFSFDYMNNSGQTKQVRNGKFNVLY